MILQSIRTHSPLQTLLLSLLCCFGSLLVGEEGKPAGEVEEQPAEEVGDVSTLPEVELEPPERVGDYQIKIGGGGPEFSNIEHFDTLYGSPGVSFSVKVDYFFNKSGVVWGLQAYLSYFRDEGFASTSEEPSNSTLDRNQAIELVLVPFGGGVNLQAPLLGDYVLLDLWAGVGAVYVQETRNQVIQTTGTTTEQNTADDDGTTTTTTSDAGSSGDQDVFVNNGTNYEYRVGLAVNLKLNWIEPGYEKTRRRSGVRAVFLSPYVETVFSATDRMGDFSRTIYGAAITFHTL